MKTTMSTKKLIGRSASDLIGLNPLDNVIFFIASTLNLDEISKSLETSTQQMFTYNIKKHQLRNVSGYGANKCVEFRVLYI